MKLSKNFGLVEFTKSQTALRQGIDNSPYPEHLGNLQELCSGVLQPLREAVGEVIIINSGYRCAELNRAIGGAKHSQHMLGQAADIECYALSTRQLFERVQELNLPFDQLILEYHDDSDKHSGWVHISHVNPQSNRHQVLEIGCV